MRTDKENGNLAGRSRSIGGAQVNLFCLRGSVPISVIRGEGFAQDGKLSIFSSTEITERTQVMLELRNDD
jgi:hypothetical protein